MIAINQLSPDLSIIPTNINKTPKMGWKQYQQEPPALDSWYNHYTENGYVGIITGRVSGNFEAIDIDIKNDPTGKIIREFEELVPTDLYERLLVVKTPSGGRHYRYRCPSITIENNQVLARHKDKATIIETRGEGGYVCHHETSYTVLQGKFELASLDYAIPVITQEERLLLLELARSLNRDYNNTTREFRSKSEAINKFNTEFDIVSVFEKHGWTVQFTDNDKISLLRPGGSTAQRSGVYFKADQIFFCFSTSTDFKVLQPYNHYQALQVLEGVKDYRATLKLLGEWGFHDKGNLTEDKRVNEQQIADYLNERGLRHNTLIQETTFNGKKMEEMDSNTLFIQLKQHFGKEVPRAMYENVVKSHLIEKENPIMDFVNKHTNRNPEGAIQKWVDCLYLNNQNISKDLVVYFVKKWFVGMIAQCLDGEYPNEFFLALLSAKQGVGKTTLLRHYTLPEELQDYRKEVSFNDDDNFKLVMSQSILIIDDEMDGRTFSENQTFKAVLSTKESTIRRPYDRYLSTLRRRCSFAGCGNQINVIRERQNRRVIPIEIAGIDFEMVAQLDTTNIFMEAYNLYSEGFKYSFEYGDSDKLNQLAGEYHLKSDIDEIIDECIINPDNDSDEIAVTAIKLVSALNHKYPFFTKKVNVINLGKILADRGIKSKRIGSNKVTNYLISSRSSIIEAIQDLAQIETAQNQFLG